MFRERKKDMKTIYGIKQKYNLKDYVEYYQSKNGRGEACNKQYGWISCVEYRCTLEGEIRLTYVITDFIGSTSGYCIDQDSIIKRATPKIPNYGFRDYLRNKIEQNENNIEILKKQIEHDTQTLKELLDTCYENL